MDANLITAWATVAGVVVAFIALWRQLKLSRYALGADLVFKADEKFSRMRKERQQAAECLLAFNENSKDDRADDVMDFFDTIGLLVRRKILDKETAWSLFYWWIVGYWEAAQKCKYIEKKKGEYGDETWEDFEVLYNAVRKLEGRKGSWTDAEIKEFLNKERVA